MISTRIVTADGIRNINKVENQLNELKMWPDNILDLVLPDRSKVGRDEKRDVLLACSICGHVQKKSVSEQFNDKCKNDFCPFCRRISQFLQLCLGVEIGFYIDFGPPLYSFVPCGHMVNEETAKYWASVPIPCIKSGFYSACPFCGIAFDGSTGYIKLIFSDFIRNLGNNAELF